MAKETIHPTNHAIERFEERVLPHISENAKKRIKTKEVVKQRLYRLINRAKLYVEEIQNEIVQVFFTPVGDKKLAPIPITLVINPIKRILVTIYITPGWVKDETPNKTVWRLTA